MGSARSMTGDLSLVKYTVELYLTENPIKIKHTLPEIAVFAMLKTIKYKGN